jgi:hypothetical protein
VTDDLAENSVGAGFVLWIGGMVFVPGFGDEAAKGVVMFRLQDQVEEFVLFLGGTRLFYVPAKQVS